jgi:dienelactone hydrolase
VRADTVKLWSVSAGSFIAYAAMFAMLCFALWQGPGLLTALRAVPPDRVSQVLEVRIIETSIPVPPRPALPATSYPARVFMPEAEAGTRSPARLPVVVYMPGWGGRATDTDVLLKRIAADGYLVLAIHDVAHDVPGKDESPDDRLARSAPFDFDIEGGAARFMALADRKANLASIKIARVVDAVAADQAEEPLGRADPRRIAALGFSFGGSAAEAALRDDPRIRAAVNLDGWNLGSSAARPTDRPYLTFTSTNSMPPVEWGRVRRNLWDADRMSWQREWTQLALPRSRHYVIPGTLHGDYSDELHGAGRWMQWRPWNAPLAHPARVRRVVDQVVLTFLADHVRAQSTAMPARVCGEPGQASCPPSGSN